MDESVASAAHRALGVPEILGHVFLELDSPWAFTAVSRAFHATAKKPVNIRHHFERRYYPAEILFELIRRPSIARPELAKALIAGGAVCSAVLVRILAECRLAVPDERSYGYVFDCAGSIQRRPGGAVTALTTGRELIATLVEDSPYIAVEVPMDSDGAAPLLTYRPTSHEYGDTLTSLIAARIQPNTMGIAHYRQNIREYIELHGLPAYSRQMIVELVLCILTAGTDLEWRMGVLKAAGAPPMTDPAFMQDVLNRLWGHASCGSLLPHFTAINRLRLGPRLPVQACALLLAMNPAAVYQTVCSLLLRKRQHFDDSLGPSGINARKDSSANKVDCLILVYAEEGFPQNEPEIAQLSVPFATQSRSWLLCFFVTRQNDLRTLAIRLLASFNGDRLAGPGQARHFVKIWRDYVYANGAPFQDNVKHLESLLKAKMYRLSLTNKAAFEGLGIVTNSSEGFTSSESWVEYLLDPWLPPLDFYGAITTGSEFIKRKSKITGILESVAPSLLKSSTSGANLIVLAQSQRWVPAFVEKALLTDLSCAQHVLIAPRVQDVLTEDPIELGVNKYRAAVTEVHPEYGMTVPSKNVVPTAVAILSLVRDRKSPALQLILAEARKRGFAQIVKVYEEAGVKVQRQALAAWQKRASQPNRPALL